LLRVVPAGVVGNKALLAAAMGERGCDSQAIAVLQTPDK